jgi:hypothetical protein
MGRAADCSTGTAGKGTAFTAKEKALCCGFSGSGPGSLATGTTVAPGSGVGAGVGSGIGSSIFFSLGIASK